MLTYTASWNSSCKGLWEKLPVSPMFLAVALLPETPGGISLTTSVPALYWDSSLHAL